MVPAMYMVGVLLVSGNVFFRRAGFLPGNSAHQLRVFG